MRPWGSSGWYPSAAVGSLTDGWKAFTSTWSFSFHAGELSPLSKVVVGGRHQQHVGYKPLQSIEAPPAVDIRSPSVQTTTPEEAARVHQKLINSVV